MLSRRTFAGLLGAGLSSHIFGESSSPEQMPLGEAKFPRGFLWGAATAAYQVEGAVAEGGRGLSIWDTFSHKEGNTPKGETGDIADDFFHRYREDIGLAASLGIQAFRFSVSWTRIFPSGKGQPLPNGLDFYKRLVHELKESNIEPFCTLYHWDLPQALQDAGGWENIDTAQRLSDYSGYVAGELSRVGVRYFMTTNEIRTFTGIGYGTGQHAPGLKIGRKRALQAIHHVLLGHGLSVQAIRSVCGSEVQIGIAENPSAIVPATQSPSDLAAARIAMREENAGIVTAICEGRYTQNYLDRMGGDAPEFTPEQMRIIATPLDMLGLNVYAPIYCRASGDTAGYEILPIGKNFPRMASPWLAVGPESIRWAPRLAYELWKPRAIYITENGSDGNDTLTPQGEVFDTERVMYLRNYLSQLSRSIAEGVPVKGYFCWSLLDNFEWSEGYEKRFGLIYVDYATQKRTPKLSAAFYKSVISMNSVV